MLTNKTIFICALDWGLGHATRCVPLIKSLQKNNTLIIGITPLTQQIFKEEFPEIQKIEVPAYNISYSNKISIGLKLILDAPRILKTIKKENKLLQEIIANYKIDIVISDNRFGLYSKNAHCIFLTHQVFLKTPFANAIAQNINKKYILNFNELWIPDEEDETTSLSGSLSHNTHFHKKVRYIGALSRLEKNNSSEKKYDYLFLISGPEPQQTVFTNLLIKKIQEYSQLKFAMVLPQTFKTEIKNIEIITLPNSKKLSEIILQSKKIICRSGYSTLMDLQKLQVDFKTVCIVPTPSQTEQGYLADYISNKYYAKVVLQKQIYTLELN